MSRPTVTGIYVPWIFIKTLVNANNLIVHYTEDDKKYHIQIYNGSTLYKTTIIKDGVDVGGSEWDPVQNALDRTDFLDNYKPDANGLEKTAIRIENDQELNVNVQSATVSKKLRYAQMTANQSLTKDVYTTVYEYTGSGNFFGCYFSAADSDMEVKITVDGEVIVSDLNISNLPIAGSGNSGNGVAGSIFIWRAEGDEINFQPPNAIAYTASVKVELKAHHNSSSKRKMTFGYTVLTKET